MPSRPRPLKFRDVFCLGLNAIVGSGIFLFPGVMAAQAGPSAVLAFLVCGALLITIALCYAELGGMFPANGAAYLYSREAFGPETGFGVGLITWAASVLSWAAVASMLSSHLGYFHPVFSSTIAVKAVAAASILFFGAVNYRGVVPGAWTVNALTAAKILPLTAFVAAGIYRMEPENFRPFSPPESHFGYAVFLALWTLQGFEAAPVPAGETSDPQRSIPLATVGSLLFAVVLYALIETVAVGVYPGLSSSRERPLADAAAYLLGPWAGGALALAGVVSMTGFLAGEALGAPRYLSALGGEAFKILRLDAVHERFATPHRAIGATAAGAVVLSSLLDFSRLIDLTNLAIVVQYFFSCAALCVLRLKQPDRPRPFRVAWAWLVAPAGCLVSLWLMTRISPMEIAWSALVLLAGILLKRAADSRAP